jgi:type VI secretion system protein VasD
VRIAVAAAGSVPRRRPAAVGRHLALCVLAASLGACAAKPAKPAVASFVVSARADANPDATGRPSPIVVRVYQLKSDAGFGNAEFFALFDDDKRVLAADLVGREEFELAPGETRTVELNLSPDTRFMGALGAYRDVRDATWRASEPVAGGRQRNVKVVVVAERARLTLAVSP